MLTEASGHVGGGAGGRVLGLATWGPCVVDGAWCSGASLHCLSQLAQATKADLHVNLRGRIPPRTLFAARGMRWPSGLPGNNKKTKKRMLWTNAHLAALD